MRVKTQYCAKVNTLHSVSCESQFHTYVHCVHDGVPDGVPDGVLDDVHGVLDGGPDDVLCAPVLPGE
jgi:hypothetical protein